MEIFKRLLGVLFYFIFLPFLLVYFRGESILDFPFRAERAGIFGHVCEVEIGISETPS